MRTRGCALVALALLGACVAPATAKSLPRLAAVTTISGSTTGYVRVTLPARARLGNPAFTARRGSISVTGGGRFAAFALVQEGFTGAMIVGGHTDFTRSDTARAGEIVADLSGKSDLDGVDFLLPAGTYRLYLIPDGKKATVTLRFDGLRGRADLRPAVGRAATVQDAMRVDPRTANGLLSFGGERTATGPMIRFGLTALRFDAHTETSTSFCDFKGAPSGPDPYLPGCPSPTGEGSWTHFLISDEYVGEGSLLSYGMGFYQPGAYGAGLAVVTGSVVTAADAKQVWVDL